MREAITIPNKIRPLKPSDTNNGAASVLRVNAPVRTAFCFGREVSELFRLAKAGTVYITIGGSLFLLVSERNKKASIFCKKILA